MNIRLIKGISSLLRTLTFSGTVFSVQEGVPMNYIQPFSFISVVALTASAPVHGQRLDTGKMNVLFIIADDMRPELGCYGVDDIVTPYIDHIAAQATVFLNAYCNIPVSGASRASLFTGIYPHYPERFTAFDASAEKDCPEAVSLPECFKENGYYVVSNGKVFHNITDHAHDWSESPWRVHPDGYGKDWAEYNKWELWQNDESARYISPKTLRGPFYESVDVLDTAYIDGRVAQKTIADLRRLKDKEQPFFLACGFWKPHLPFNAPKKYWDLYKREEIRLASNAYCPEGLPKQVTSSGEIRGYGKFTSFKDEEFQRNAKHGYYACVSYVDAQIGLILNELERLGLEESTIVIIIGDHGWHLGEHGFWGKHNLMNHSTRAPLIVRVPHCKGGKAGGIVEFVDIYPTLCELCEIPVPGSQLQGKSFVPILKDCGERTKKYAFVQWSGGYNLVSENYSTTIWLKNDSVTARMMFDRRVDAAENENRAVHDYLKKEMEKQEAYIVDRKRELEE